MTYKAFVLILTINGCANVQQIRHDTQAGTVTVCGQVSNRVGIQSKANKTCSTDANVVQCSLTDSKYMLLSIFDVSSFIQSAIVSMHETCCIFQC